VVSLYVARNEIQRAADAAALVGAKAIADSGVTSLPPNDGNAGAAEALAGSMATSAINALINSPGFNQVAGGPVTEVGTPTIFYNDPSGNNLTNDVTITVTLQRTNLPSFFSRIWGSRVTTTSATAVAEAYNPANMPEFTPIATRCVKPWLVANHDPGTGNPFVTVATGQVETGLVGKTLYLVPDCNENQPGAGCPLIDNPPTSAGQFVEYVPASVTTNTQNVCSSQCSGTSAYEQSIYCCDQQLYSCGGTTTNAGWDSTVNPNPNRGGTNSSTATATECLIHATGAELGQGQDTIDDLSLWPNSGPPRITAQSPPMSAQPVSTTSSIVSIPIMDTCTGGGCFPNFSAPVTVVGFFQAFIQAVSDQGNQRHSAVYITILNVVGCGQSPNTNPVVVGGNGNSPIAVRLVAPPPGP